MPDAPGTSGFAPTLYRAAGYMRTKARWLQGAQRSATMMAFLAVVALLVSPALALACCCDDAPPAIHSAVAAQNLHCHDAGAVAAHHATIRANCDCDSVLADATFVTSDNARFFAPIFAVVPAQTSPISFVADARRAHYAHFAARPRAPDRTSIRGRAPPALAQS